MFGKRLNELEARKQLLVMQCDLNREMLRLEGAEIRERWESVKDSARMRVPWVATAGVLAVLGANRKYGRLAGWVAKALRIWRLARG